MGADLIAWRSCPLQRELEAVGFFVSQVEQKDTIGELRYRDVVSKVPASGTHWHDNRGGAGALAQRAQPLQHRWGGVFSKKSVDSAQVLRCLFRSLETPGLI